MKQNRKLYAHNACISCGEHIRSGQNFCPVCGSPVKSPAELLAQAKAQNCEALSVLLDCYERPVRIAALSITKREPLAGQIADQVLQNITSIEAEDTASLETQITAMIRQKAMNYMIDQLAKSENPLFAPAGKTAAVLKN